MTFNVNVGQWWSNPTGELWRVTHVRRRTATLKTSKSWGVITANVNIDRLIDSRDWTLHQEAAPPHTADLDQPKPKNGPVN